MLENLASIESDLFYKKANWRRQQRVYTSVKGGGWVRSQCKIQITFAGSFFLLSLPQSFMSHFFLSLARPCQNEHPALRELQYYMLISHRLITEMGRPRVKSLYWQAATSIYNVYRSIFLYLFNKHTVK